MAWLKMQNKVKFEATSPLGYTVQCRESDWAHIIKHGAMAGNEKAVIETIEDPLVIFPSKSHQNDRFVYYGDPTATYKTEYTAVVVEQRNDEFYVTKTAYPAKKFGNNTQGGDVLYVRNRSR